MRTWISVLLTLLVSLPLQAGGLSTKDKYGLGAIAVGGVLAVLAFDFHEESCTGVSTTFRDNRPFARSTSYCTTTYGDSIWVEETPTTIRLARPGLIYVGIGAGDVPAAVEFGRVAAAPVNTLRQQPHRCQEISVCF